MVAGNWRFKISDFRGRLVYKQIKLGLIIKYSLTNYTPFSTPCPTFLLSFHPFHPTVLA